VPGFDVDAGGHNLRYQEAGSGPAVLLLHAGGADSGMWADVWEEPPVLVLWGDGDEEGIQLVGDRMVKGVPGARRIIFPSVDHFVSMRAPGPSSTL
jgi:pimeloyl-ACP methyl ester carboxylesterase